MTSERMRRAKPPRASGLGNEVVTHAEEDEASECSSTSTFDWAEEADDESAFDFFSGQVVGTIQDGSPETNIDAPGAHDKDSNRKDTWQWLPLLDVNHIRVLYIEPASGPDDNSPVSCRFERVSLGDYCDYFALSYTWGETKADGSHLSDGITVDGYPFMVTSNLHRALRRLRRWRGPSSSGLQIPAVWIDAICIDQSDPTERSRQVMLMDKIYQNARHLIIWLGELGEDPQKILEDNMKALVEHIADEEVEAERAAFVNFQLRQRRYFKRRWVIQEVFCCRGPHTLLVADYQLLATNVTTVLGQRDQPLEFTTYDQLASTYGRLAAVSDASGHSLFNQLTSKTLLQNLIDFEDAECSDDRDRVYALRNVSSDGKHLKVDYRKDSEELFRALAAQWIAAGQLRVVLQAAVAQRLTASHPDNLDEINDISTRCTPTWIPRWLQRPPVFVNALRLDAFFSTPRTMASLEPPSRSATENPNPYEVDGIFLRCRGFVLEPCEHHENVPAGPLDESCRYCFLLEILREGGARSMTDGKPWSLGGICCVLVHSNLAFGVSRTGHEGPSTWERAYSVRTRIYDMPMKEGAWYNPSDGRSVAAFAPGTVTLV
ncbi:Hypothetical predicted protein [Lecanosticta acicola]|uniref:Heterokaryon incompatibility domain-containing protein n=1 Tax=Lecanosticta acicola TaxID=111012 RepID=A0AAI8YRG4_9PEZI|nr:Hypothetical predicted protein [Lecanosticta acicola]